MNRGRVGNNSDTQRGLGNQLFIFSAARALALRTGRRLYIDNVRGYTDDGYGRSYRLNRFPIHAEQMPEEWRVAPTLSHPRHRFIRTFSRLWPRDWRAYLSENRRLGAGQLVSLKPRRLRVTLLGYWQSEEYFSDQADIIFRELSPPPPTDARNLTIGEEMTRTNSAFLHVRRVRYNPTLGEDYYQLAVDSLIKREGGIRFYVVGDDLPWARNRLNFGSAFVNYLDHNGTDELADFWLMTRCRHAIVANSSFSWWGAWLGRSNANRVVYFPANSGWPVASARGWSTIPGSLIYK